MPRGDINQEFFAAPDYEKYIAELEMETEQKISQTMSAIESAVEAWKEAGEKPPSLKPKIQRLKVFYNELVNWEKRSLQKKEKKDIRSRMERLKEFVNICMRYEEENQKRVG